MKKTIYKVCKYCGRKNTCYETQEISMGEITKGELMTLIHCVRLDEVNRSAVSRINKLMSEVMFGKRSEQNKLK